MNLAANFISKIDDRFYASAENDPNFIQTVVDHFPYIRASESRFSSFDVSADFGAIYTGDFHGLLMKKGLDARHNTINTLFNGFIKTTDYTGEPGRIIFVEPEVIAKLKKTYSTRRR